MMMMVRSENWSGNLQGLPPFIHASGPCQNQAGVGVLHPLLHLTPEFAPTPQPCQKALQVVAIKVCPTAGLEHMSGMVSALPSNSKYLC